MTSEQIDPWAGIFLNRRQEWGQESDSYIIEVLNAHTPALQTGEGSFKGRCMHCGFTREPCDTASVAATALVRADQLAASRANEARLRAFVENVRDNWGALTGSELKDQARAALAAAAAPAQGEGDE